jgi:hypothetical protein
VLNTNQSINKKIHMKKTYPEEKYEDIEDGWQFYPGLSL